MLAAKAEESKQQKSVRLHTVTPGALTVAVYANFFPVAYRSGDDLKGLEVDLMHEFSTLKGLELRFKESAVFDGVWRYPVHGKSDVAIGGITVAECRRRPDLQWSDPYFHVSRTLVYNKRLSPVHSFPEGVTAIIRATPGSTGYADAEARLLRVGKGGLLHDSTDDEQDIAMLRAGSIQGLVRGSFVGKAIVERYPDELAMLEPWTILPELKPTEEGEVFMLPTRAGTGLAEELTRFLSGKAKDGTMRTLLEKHRLI